MRRTRIVAVAVVMLLMTMMLPAAPVGAVTGVTNLTNSGGALGLANILIGGDSGVEIVSATATGNAQALGSFTGGLESVGFEDGVVLSTGNISSIPGSAGTSASTNWGAAGDADLGELIGRTTNDAAILNISFIPTGDQVFFRYVFGSEEYLTYIGTQYNDVFAFWVNGVNCALVGDQPVSVNTINPNVNGDLYRHNNGLPSSINGFTKILTCQAAVNSGEVNTLRLAIADATDSILDSVVFIKAGSFTTTPEVTVDDIEGDEGSAIPLSASVNDPDSPDPILTWSIEDIDPATVQCVLENEDQIDATLTCDDNASVTVKLTVDDEISPISSDTGIVTVNNVAPEATFSAPSSATGGGTFEISLTDATDVSSADTAAGFTYAFDCGDGYGAASSTAAATCAATIVPTQTVKGKVIDKDGGESEYTAEVGVSYTFGKWMAPLSESSTLRVKRNSVLAVSFTLGGDSSGYSGADAQLWVAPVVGNTVGKEQAAVGTPFNQGNWFRPHPLVPGQYMFTWNTFGLPTGVYQLRVDLGDGQTHTVRVQIVP
jgi:hypothetical protein